MPHKVLYTYCASTPKDLETPFCCQEDQLLKIIPVEGYRAMGRFIHVPWSIYAATRRPGQCTLATREP